MLLCCNQVQGFDSQFVYAFCHICSSTLPAGLNALLCLPAVNINSCQSRRPMVSFSVAVCQLPT